MRETVGRGETPRQNGRCVHQWHASQEGAGYVCRSCGAERPSCPHDWVWTMSVGRWSCRVCGAEQLDTARPASE